MMINQYIVGETEIKNFLQFENVYENTKIIRWKKIIDRLKYFKCCIKNY